MKSRTLNCALVATSIVYSTFTMAAETFGPLEISGFAKDEYTICNNCSPDLVNPTAYDSRGVFTSEDPMLNQGGESKRTDTNVYLLQLSLGLSHEFDNALKVEAKASGRMRDGEADIFDNYLIDGFVGISYPKLGSLQVGKMTSRSWTRSDSFSYSVGLSGPWAESGAGYGLFPEAIRYATPEMEVPMGKLRLEASVVSAQKRNPLNVSSITVPPPSPNLYEIFIQFSKEKHLIEAIYQDSSGGRQSSFSKGAFYGAQGNTNISSDSPGYRAPYENVLILQGNYWRNNQWKFTYGLKRSEWSGQQQQCDYGPTASGNLDCFWDQPGFNYSSDKKLYSAVEYDAMLGVSYSLQPWVFTLGAVQMNEASTKNPTEWGQSNSATFLNLGAYRKISKYIEVYGGLGGVIFDMQGPAPLSMPNNIAFGGVDPRTSQSGTSLTIGANLLF